MERLPGYLYCLTGAPPPATGPLEKYKLKRYCSRSISLRNEKLRTIFEVKRGTLNLVLLFLLYAKVDLIRLTPYATGNLTFAISRHQKRMTLQNALQNIEHRVSYLARNFARISFCDVTKVQNAGLPMVRDKNGLNLFSKIRRIVEQRLGRPFIMSIRTSHYFI